MNINPVVQVQPKQAASTSKKVETKSACSCCSTSVCSFQGNLNASASQPTTSSRDANSLSLSSRDVNQNVSFGFADILAFGGFFALMWAIFKTSNKTSAAAKKMMARIQLQHPPEIPY